MRFYNRQYRHYCGIDLHVKTMFVCLLDAAGQVLVHRNVPSTSEAFLEIIAPYRDDLVVAAECMFTWYWLADVCAAEGITFVLGHALAMKAIHGGKAKNDKIDSHKIASLLRGGLLRQSYVLYSANNRDGIPTALRSPWLATVARDEDPRIGPATARWPSESGSHFQRRPVSSHANGSVERAVTMTNAKERGSPGLREELQSKTRRPHNACRGGTPATY